MVPPEFLEKRCRSSEKEVTCSFRSSESFGPRTVDDCKKYANDPNYYFLTGRSYGTGLGGEEKYCLNSSNSSGALDIQDDFGLNGGNYLIETIAVIVVGAISSFALYFIKRKNVRK